jgi:magnesium transporter
MVSNCWINVECPTEAEKSMFWMNSNSEAFYNDIEDIDEPRIEVENGWTLIIMRIPVKSNDTFQYHSCRSCFKEEVCAISFHKTEMLTDFVTYSNKRTLISKIISI